MLLCVAFGCGSHTYYLTPQLTEIPEGYWVYPSCMRKGVTVEAIEARSQKESRQPPEPPKYLRILQGSIVTAAGRGRKGQPGKRLGVASYSGKEGRTHYCSIELQ